MEVLAQVGPGTRELHLFEAGDDAVHVRQDINLVRFLAAQGDDRAAPQPGARNQDVDGFAGADGLALGGPFKDRRAAVVGLEQARIDRIEVHRQLDRIFRRLAELHVGCPGRIGPGAGDPDADLLQPGWQGNQGGERRLG